MYCIDASVLISAARGNEIDSPRSRAFLDRIRAERMTVFFPEIVISEIVSGLVRATGDSGYALEFVEILRAVPNFVFVSVDRQLVDTAATVIAHTKLRSADALYVALAAVYRIPLVTLDREQLRKGREIVHTQLPE